MACPFGLMQIVLTPVAAGNRRTGPRINATFVRGANGPACVENCPGGARCNWSLTSHSPAWRNPRRLPHRASGTSRPWHASTAAQEMPVMSKVEQMQATPAH
ncbi:hypothetical protein ACNKHT_15950 [Shigella flexneri]